MKQNPANEFFTAEEVREITLVVSFSICLVSICSFISLSVLPEHCELFSSNTQLCHTIPLPAGCEPCKNIATAWAASFVMALGICSFFLPFLVFAIKEWLNRPARETKLFD
jgi:F0F1-type ATP synthase assembly protein I